MVWLLLGGVVFLLHVLAYCEIGFITALHTTTLGFITALHTTTLHISQHCTGKTSSLYSLKKIQNKHNYNAFANNDHFSKQFAESNLKIGC